MRSPCCHGVGGDRHDAAAQLPGYDHRLPKGVPAAKYFASCSRQCSCWRCRETTSSTLSSSWTRPGSETPPTISDSRPLQAWPHCLSVSSCSTTTRTSTVPMPCWELAVHATRFLDGTAHQGAVPPEAIIMQEHELLAALSFVVSAPTVSDWIEVLFRRTEVNSARRATQLHRFAAETARTSVKLSCLR